MINLNNKNLYKLLNIYLSDVFIILLIYLICGVDKINFNLWVILIKIYRKKDFFCIGLKFLI